LHTAIGGFVLRIQVYKFELANMVSLVHGRTL
jgi:hypothetical protein